MVKKMEYQVISSEQVLIDIAKQRSLTNPRNPKSKRCQSGLTVSG